MPDVVVGHIDSSNFDRVAREFHTWSPASLLARGVIEGETEIASDTLRYIWLESGSGECFIPEGARTQEGDGKPLDAIYVPDLPQPTVMDALASLEASLDAFASALRVPIEAVVARRRGSHFIGDIAGEIWLLLESGVPRSEWADSPRADAALNVVIDAFRQIGWSEKSAGSWEPIEAGDQLAVTPQTPLRVRGVFRYWSIDVTDRVSTHTSRTRRLPHLARHSGGLQLRLRRVSTSPPPPGSRTRVRGTTTA